MQNLRTLVFLVQDGRVLLAVKKRGFGAGKWNGVGGKLLPGESLKEAAAREVLEEIGVKVRQSNLQRVATLNFLFPDLPTDANMNVTVCVYVCKRWRSRPTESEEMQPRWFSHNKIPYPKMWWDDTFWLPKVLEGKLIKGDFYFKLDPKTKLPVGDHYLIHEGSWR